MSDGYDLGLLRGVSAIVSSDLEGPAAVPAIALGAVLNVLGEYEGLLDFPENDGAAIWGEIYEAISLAYVPNRGDFVPVDQSNVEDADIVEDQTETWEGEPF